MGVMGAWRDLSYHQWRGTLRFLLLLNMVTAAAFELYTVGLFLRRFCGKDCACGGKDCHAPGEPPCSTMSCRVANRYEARLCIPASPAICRLPHAAGHR